MTTKEAIDAACEELRKFLQAKNESYGDSALNPQSYFCDLGARERIEARIDEKLNRILRGKQYAGDDDLKDVAGLYVMRRAQELYQPSLVHNTHQASAYGYSAVGRSQGEALDRLHRRLVDDGCIAEDEEIEDANVWKMGEVGV